MNRRRKPEHSGRLPAVVVALDELEAVEDDVRMVAGADGQRQGAAAALVGGLVTRGRRDPVDGGVGAGPDHALIDGHAHQRQQEAAFRAIGVVEADLVEPGRRQVVAPLAGDALHPRDCLTDQFLHGRLPFIPFARSRVARQRFVLSAPPTEDPRQRSYHIISFHNSVVKFECSGQQIVSRRIVEALPSSGRRVWASRRPTTDSAMAR